MNDIAVGAAWDAAAKMFELDEVSFSVSGRTLLGPLTTTLSAGRVIGLIGHNGSGKSTLLKMLARQQLPSKGAIRFEGKELSKWNNRALARKIAYLPQQTPTGTGMLVRELVALGRYPWHGALGRFGRSDLEKVDEAIEQTGMVPFADRLVDTLSGGERQRAWLAMLLAQDAECLLLDEPISALDVTHQLEILSLIKSICAATGLGAVIVLHDINMAARFCDEIIALRMGRLSACGSVEEIVTPDCLRDIYNLQMNVIRHPSRNHPVAVPC